MSGLGRKPFELTEPSVLIDSGMRHLARQKPSVTHAHQGERMGVDFPISRATGGTRMLESTPLFELRLKFLRIEFRWVVVHG